MVCGLSWAAMAKEPWGAVLRRASFLLEITRSVERRGARRSSVRIQTELSERANDQATLRESDFILKTTRGRYPISETSSSRADGPAFTQVFFSSSAPILTASDLGYRLRGFFTPQPRRTYFRARKPPRAMWSRRCCSIWASTSRSMAPSCCSSPPSEVRPISCMTPISIPWP